MNFSQEIEICIQTLSIDSLTSSSIFRFSIKISSDRRWFTSHVFWEVEINEFATTSIALVLFAQLWQMQFQKQWSFHTIHVTSYLNATIIFVFETIKFEIFKSTHARESFSRQFSISIHDSRFSKIFHSTSICKRCQDYFVIYLLSSWLASIVLRIESNEIFMKISFLRECWSEKVTKVVVFEFLVSDFFTLRKSLLRKSSKSCKFVSILFVRSIIHLKRTSWFEKV